MVLAAWAMVFFFESLPRVKPLWWVWQISACLTVVVLPGCDKNGDPTGTHIHIDAVEDFGRVFLILEANT